MTAKEASGPQAAEQLRGWLSGRLPDEWFEGPPEIVVDREEITIIGTLAGPAQAQAAQPASAGAQGAGAQGAGGAAAEQGAGGQGAGGQGAGGQGGAAAGAGAGEAAPGETGLGTEAAAAALGRARRFREETREARIEIAREIEHMSGRKVSWGVICGGRKVMYTTLSVPVMTRLRQTERRVLDTLVDAGVARSRSDALAWCVRLVGQHQDSWLDELREALRRVEEVRAAGPAA